MIITDTSIEIVALCSAFDRSMAAGEKCNSATHRFYTVRKRLVSEYPRMANISASDFFPMYKAKKAQRMPKNRRHDGDFDDMGMTRMAGEYYGWNKHKRGRL